MPNTASTLFIELIEMQGRGIKRMDKREAFNVLSMSPFYSSDQMGDMSKSEV